MKKLLAVLLFLIGASGSYANHFTVGSGSGSLSLNSMTGHQPGDTALITAGSYSSGGFSNLKGIVILPNTPGHTVFMTGGLGFRNNDSCELGYITFSGFTGNGMDMRAYGSGVPYTNGNGPISHCYLHHLAFYNIAGSCIDANGGLLYVPGDTTRYAWYKVKFDSIYEYQCNNFCQGSYGSPVDNTGQPPNVMAQLEIGRFVSLGTTATVNQGVEIRGIIFEYNFHDWAVFDVSGRGNSGDCGLVYGHGSGTMYNIYKYGGPGYISRMAPTREVGRPGFIKEYNICKTNSTDYGVIQHQNPDTVTGKFGAVDSINVWNVTGINMASDNNYWCQVVVLGDMSCAGGTVWMKAHIHNNLGINVTDHASGDAGHDNGTFKLRIVLNMGPGQANTDTSNNQYWQTMTQAKLDSTTVLYTNVLGSFPKFNPTINSTGQILHGGIVSPLSAVDYLGLPLRTPPDIGYVQLQSTAPPINPCSCKAR